MREPNRVAAGMAIAKAKALKERAARLGRDAHDAKVVYEGSLNDQRRVALARRAGK